MRDCYCMTTRIDPVCYNHVMKFFSSRKVGDLTLILDVRSSVVYAALVLLRDDAKPHVILTVRKGIKHRSDEKSAELIKSTTDSITHIISEVSKSIYKLRLNFPSLPTKIRSVHYVLSSPWILSESRHIKVSFDSPKVVTDTLIHEIIDREREKNSSGSRKIAGTLQVEQKIFNIELNGYPISEWVGKKVNAISISFVTSISGERMIEKLRDICAPIVKGQDVFFHSSLSLQYLGIEHMSPNKKNYTIVHIHGEITDVLVVKNHSCAYFGTYPIGSETILRTISKSGGVGLKTASSMKSLNISGIVDQSHNDWLCQLRKTLESGKQHLDDSSSILLSVDEDREHYSRVLKRTFPKVSVESISRDDTGLEVTYEPSCERAVMVDLDIIALEKFRPQLAFVI